MTISRWIATSFALALAALVLGSPDRRATAQEADPPTADPPVVLEVVSDADPLEVPDGSPAELLAFIEELAQPKQQFTSQDELREYLDNISQAINTAADKVLAADADEQQLIDAMEWKVEAWRIRAQLGDEQADAKTDQFLDKMAADPRPAVAEAAQQVQSYRQEMQFVQTWMAKLQQLPGLDAAGRAEMVQNLVDEIKSGDVFANQLVVLIQFADMLSDSQDPAPAIDAVNELLPKFRASDDPDIVERLPLVEGIARRLNLPGNELELSGSFVDGTELNWSDYRGKVVLVDFWATWCGPCLAEMPNVIENYRNYNDKGFEVLGISLDEDRQELEQFLAEANMPWQTLFNDDASEGGFQHPMAEKYGITGIPRAILVDQQGKVVNLNARGDELTQELRRLLGEPAPDEEAAVDDDDPSKTAQNTTG